MGNIEEIGNSKKYQLDVKDDNSESDEKGDDNEHKI